MSGHRYTTSTANFDDDDVDDETFLRNSRKPPANSFDEQVQSFQERRRDIEERTIQSSERSIGLLRDSEQIGIATAEELARQREQLERTDKRLDEINHTLRFSQKHINGIKSVFSSLKNYMSGRNDQQTPSTPSTTKVNNSNTNEPVNTSFDRYDSHPVTRLKGHPSEYSSTATSPSGSKQISQRLEANLNEMSSSISRLKGLATDLSSEIDTQNELIEGIMYKTETADYSIQRQNKDMNKILGKK